MKTFAYAKAIMIAGLAAPLWGCVMAQVARLGPEASFVHPNSNVTPLGPVNVKSAGPVELRIAGYTIDSAEWEKLNCEALRKYADANVIVDYAKIATVRWLWLPIPYIPLHLTWTVYRLEGSAARMEVGEQYLR